jgi:hypothetical protein
MSEQEKARDVARLLTAWAEKKTLQRRLLTGEWIDYPSTDLPVISEPSCWRIKPEPRRKWQTSHSETFSAIVAAEWKAEGYTVTEWQEVVS